MDKKWCVYVHISPSGKYYVGITSQKPERRWQNGDGYKSNKHFYNAIQKYGWDNFQHEIIANNITEDEAKNFEKILIAKLQSNKFKYGYNRSSGGESSSGISRFGSNNSFYGKHHSEETKQYLSELHKGRTSYFLGKHHSDETRQMLRESKGTSVCQYSINMNFISEYQSVREASEKTGVDISTILKCCHKKEGNKTAGGFIWVFKKELQNINLDEYKKYILHEKLPKKICQYTLSMEFVNEFESISQASRSTGIQFSDISRAISGKLKQAGGYIWIHKNDLEEIPFDEIKLQKKYENLRCRPVYQFSLDMRFIQEFESGTDASKNVNTTPQAILNACKSKTHKSNGYLWWYKSDYEKEAT